MNRNGTAAPRHYSRSWRAHTGAMRLARGPDSPPQIVQSTACRAAADATPELPPDLRVRQWPDPLGVAQATLL